MVYICMGMHITTARAGKDRSVQHPMGKRGEDRHIQLQQEEKANRVENIRCKHS